MCGSSSRSWRRTGPAAEAILAALEETALKGENRADRCARQRALQGVARPLPQRHRLLGETDDDRLRALARRELKRLQQAHATLGPNPTDDELHRVRIKAKRTRYAAELAGKPLAKVGDAAKRLQDAIGLHQDAVVAEERVRDVAEGASLLAAGRIIERERERRRTVRARPAEGVEAARAGRRKDLSGCAARCLQLDHRTFADAPRNNAKRDAEPLGDGTENEGAGRKRARPTRRDVESLCDFACGNRYQQVCGCRQLSGTKER